MRYININILHIKKPILCFSAHLKFDLHLLTFLPSFPFPNIGSPFIYVLPRSPGHQLGGNIVSSQRERSGGKVQQQIDGHCQPGNYRSITGLEILPPVSVPSTTSGRMDTRGGGGHDCTFMYSSTRFMLFEKKGLADLYIKYIPSK